MGWPLSQDYNEAVQSPAANFADPDLRRGQVATNALGLPMPYSGNFADVYQLVGPNGARWAVKCFTREVPGLRQRYEAIGRHLRQANLPFTVDFTYLEKGILVAGQWYPILKMEWVEGLTLSQFVAQAADKPAKLESLLKMWARMGQYLRAAGVAHADLQHGNVLLVPDAGNKALALKLVDYDGMWVPALAGGKSGEVGHPSYQHPQRGRDETYSLDVDRFPLLLVATALRALKTEGRELWEKYDNGDNLLFTEADLQAPTKSRLFQDLLRSTDALTATMAGRTIDALRGSLESAPLLEEVLPEELRPALARAAGPKSVSPSTKPVAVPVSGPDALPANPEPPPLNESPSPKPIIVLHKNARRTKRGGVIAALVVLAGVAVAVVAVLYPPTPPTPPPPPPPSPKTFEVLGKVGEWHIEDNTLVPEPPGGKQSWQDIYFGDTKWTDYDFAVEVQRLKGEGRCGLWFRHEDEKNQLLYSVGKDVARLEIFLGGPVPTFIHLPPVALAENNHWYPLRVSVRGDRFQCYRDRDGDPTSDTIPGHPRGAVGLYVDDSSFAFRKIKVTDPDGIKVLLEGLPDLR